MLEIRSLTSGYPKNLVLQSVSLSIPTGKVTVLLGPNGCGKSTLLKSVCGILPAKSGEVLLDGTNLLLLPPKLRAQKVAYLAQSRQVPDITAERLVLHGRFPYLDYPRRYQKADFDCARAAMEQMGIEDLAGARLEKLSGGQRQKVYLAMALAQDTPVILLDEPTTYLDIHYQIQLAQKIMQLARQGKTVLMILHDLPLAFRTADNLVLMERGSVIKEGAPEQLYASGAVDRIFGVKLSRAASETGWHYFCEEM